MRRACEQGRVLAEAAGVHFAYDVGVDPLTSGDPQALERLFLILLDNAVKYTPAGGHVSVAMRVADAAAIVDVSDTGVGIREDDVPLIFERFYRVDKDRSRARGGVGLGLAIAQRIAVAHGGLVTVRSVSGQGSTFSVHLPAVVPDERTTPHRNAH
ncbi:MAG: ATP-binding protein [Acidobacteriaceae bacterium]|nr:ATP-binding protein [Acidobacteriaceae bacterium]